jgi:hypothetical protein
MKKCFTLKLFEKPYFFREFIRYSFWLVGKSKYLRYKQSMNRRGIFEQKQAIKGFYFG